MASRRILVLLGAGLYACAAYHTQSLRELPPDANRIAYHVSYLASGDQVWDVADFDVRVIREGASVRLDAVLDERAVDRKPQRVSRALTDAEWQSIAECWDSQSLLWSMHDHPDWSDLDPDEPIELGGDSFRVEALRGREFRTVVVQDWERGASGQLRECVRRMFGATGLQAPSGTWWGTAPVNERPCAAPWRPTAAIPPFTPPWRGPPQRPTGMVKVPGGILTMEGGRTVPIEPFSIDAAPVSADDFMACVRAGPCWPDHLGEHSADGSRFACDPQCAAAGNDPLRCVDWAQASAYCRARGARLPTEQEWEWVMLPEARDEQQPGIGDSVAKERAWEWTSSGSPQSHVLRGIRHGLPTDPKGGLVAVYTERAERPAGYRQPFLEFRCAR